MTNGPPVINVHGRRDVDLRCFASLGFSVQFSYIVSVLRYKTRVIQKDRMIKQLDRQIYMNYIDAGRSIIALSTFTPFRG